MIVWCQVILKLLQLKFPKSWHKAALVPIKNTMRHKERNTEEVEVSCQKKAAARWT